MSTYTKFSRLSLATKIRLRENLQVKYFTGENIPIYGMHIISGNAVRGHLSKNYLTQIMKYMYSRFTVRILHVLW